MKSILNLSPSKLKNKTVLLRVDFNVPLIKGKITDDFRIKKTLPTVKELMKRGAKVVLISHLELDGKILSLSRIAKHLNKHDLKKLKFVSDIIGKRAKAAIEKLKPGEVLMLENLRMDKAEKKNGKAFARKLASLADIYVNEAFSASHRIHASIVGVPKYLPSYFGPLFEKEVLHLKKAFRPEHPFLLVLGGKKITTKMSLLTKFFKKADKVLLGGAMINNFFKAMGLEVGQSYIEENAKPLIEGKIIDPRKMILPSDVVVLRGKKKMSVSINDTQKKDIIYDLGPDTISSVQHYIRRCKFVLWNGPLGYYEGGYDEATKTLARALTRVKAQTIVGGGDTVAILSKIKLLNKYHFVSTGGGAMLDFLAKGTLPGIKAINNK